MKIRIAQVKFKPLKGDLSANHAALMKVLHDLPHQGIDVVITPECILDGYIVTEPWSSPENVRDYAIDPADSPYVREIAGWARERKAWVVYGCMRRGPDGVYNTALLFNRGGESAGLYDKVHVNGPSDLGKFVPGKSLPVFDSDFGKFGVMICADRRWPETVRTLALRGARVVFNPTYGWSGDFNAMMVRIRSFESEVFICFTHPQEALVTNPRGEVVVCETSDTRSYVVTEIDLGETDQARDGRWAHLHHRHPEVYER